MLLTLLTTLLAGFSAEVHNPQIPVIVDRDFNVISEIVIPSETAAAVRGTVTVELSGIPAKAVRRIDLVYTGTLSPIHSRTTSNIFKSHFNLWSGGWTDWCDPDHAIVRSTAGLRGEDGRATVSLPLDGLLVKGDNHFYVSMRVASGQVDPASTFTAKVSAIEVDGAPVVLTESGPCSGRRFATALRTHGDDGSDSYRIPGLARTPEGTLLAVYDIRWDSSWDLNADIDVGVSRSTDGGKTWEKMRVAMDMGEYGGLPEAQNGVGDPCILVDDNTGDVYIAAIWAHGLGGRASIFSSSSGMEPVDVAQMVLAKSSDDGKTWSAPVNITPQVKDPSWATCFQGPGAGITMADGTLVIPFQWWDADKIPSGGVIYSRDHGATWHFDGTAVDHVCEDQVVELEPGTLMLNMRNYGNKDRFRKVYVTKDLGKTWTEHPSNNTLQEPVCQASLLKAPGYRGKDVLLFCNPDSQNARDRMTVKASTDLGRTWPHALLLDEEAGWGYSSMAMIDSETVGILYEGSTAQLVFQAVRLSALLQ